MELEAFCCQVEDDHEHHEFGCGVTNHIPVSRVLEEEYVAERKLSKRHIFEATDGVGLWPWMASVGHKWEGGKWSHICGGSLVKKSQSSWPIKILLLDRFRIGTF